MNDLTYTPIRTIQKDLTYTTIRGITYIEWRSIYKAGGELGETDAEWNPRLQMWSMPPDDEQNEEAR